MTYKGLQIGPYRLLRLIGKGGMSDVYLAEGTQIHPRVAIKLLRTDAISYANVQSPQEMVRLFRREIGLNAQLMHSTGILPIYDVGEKTVKDSTLMYMVMPYCPEGSLDDWIRQHPGQIALPLVEDILSQAAKALDYAHKRMIIHQDIKPSNFLILNKREDPEGLDLQLADFGIAKFISTTTNASTTVRGTYTYMAPEQWQGQPVPATDQYALAIMIYQLLVGSPPFQGKPAHVMYHKHMQEQAAHIYELDARLSAETDAVLQRALAKKAEDRYPSVIAFADAFQQSFHTIGPAVTVIPPGIAQTVPDVSNLAHMAPTAVEIDAKNSAPASEQKTKQDNVPDSQVTKVNSTPSSSHPTEWLTFYFTIGLSLLIGILLYSFGRLPLVLLTFFTAIGGLIALFGAAAIGDSVKAFLPNGGVKGVLTNANKWIALPCSIIIVLLLALPIWYFPSLPSCSGTNLCSPTGATAVANTTSTAEISSGMSTSNTYNTSMPYLILNDPLNSNSSTGWEERSDDIRGVCDMAELYRVTQYKPGGFTTCARSNLTISDFTYQVQMTIIKGDYGGIIFRANGDNNGNFYYLRIDVNGSYALNISKSYLYTGQTLPGDAGYTISSDHFHRGFGQTNLITVEAKGNNFSLYSNHYLFDHVVDINNTYSQGTVGIIADEKQNTTEVTFSNAKVWSADTPATIGATATIVATNSNPYSSGTGTLTLYDSLHTANQWNNQNFDPVSGKCYFIDDAYHVQELSPNFFTYCNDKTPFNNFVFEVKMTIIQGDCGGIFFRIAGDVGNGYFFQVCQDGTQAFHTIDGTNKIGTTLVKSTSSTLVHRGLNQVNTIAVVANDKTFTLYVNYAPVASVTDGTYSDGLLGLVAFPDKQATEVVYSDARAWIL